VDINSVADELYSLPPEEFTASRNLREQEAKALGDMLLAAEIHRLAKPNTAAWLANQLVREHSDEVRSFLDLGAAFSEATAMLSGDQLRELGRQRRERVRALLAQVRGLANASGHKVSQDAARAVESTLHAALADERVAEQLSAGRLTDTLQSTGFPSVANTQPAAKPSPDVAPPRSAPSEASERRADQLARAEDEERLARAAVRDAEAGQDQARAALTSTEAALQEAAALVAGLRAKLDRAETEQSRLEEERRTMRADVDRADQAAREVAQRLDEAIQGKNPSTLRSRHVGSAGSDP